MFISQHDALQASFSAALATAITNGATIDFAISIASAVQSALVALITYRHIELVNSLTTPSGGAASPKLTVPHFDISLDDWSGDDADGANCFPPLPEIPKFPTSLADDDASCDAASAALPGSSNEDDKEMKAPYDDTVLVKLVKEAQRSSKTTCRRWHEYVRAQGLFSFDPGRHKPRLLQGFLTSLSQQPSMDGSASMSDAPPALLAHSPSDMPDSAAMNDAPKGAFYEDQVEHFTWTSPSTGKPKLVAKPISDLDYMMYKLSAPTAKHAETQFAPFPIVGDTFRLPTCRFIDGSAGCRNGAKCPYSHLMQADDASIAHELQRHVDLGIKVTRVKSNEALPHDDDSDHPNVDDCPRQVADSPLDSVDMQLKSITHIADKASVPQHVHLSPPTSLSQHGNPGMKYNPSIDHSADAAAASLQILRDRGSPHSMVGT